MKRYLLLIPLIFVGCASSPIPKHTIRETPSAWDRTYTKLAYQGARSGNPPPYWLGKPTKTWQDPISYYGPLP
jgi:hypothetical protein